MSFKIVLTDNRHTDYEIEKKVLAEIGGEVVINHCTTEDELIEACKDADGLLCNLAPVTKRVVDSLEKCKVITRYGVGYDNVDIKACSEKGIYVANVPDYCMEEVSDQAMALFYACARQVAFADRNVRAGKWFSTLEKPIYRIAGKTFTLLGFGHIAKCMLRKLKGLNLGKILIYDPYVDEKTITDAGAIKVDLETALKEADYISIHMPLNPKTVGFIGKKEFALMKESAIIINTSRGPIIDRDALLYVLENEKIYAAGLDVHHNEPLLKDSPFFKLANCVLADHLGWYSEDAVADLKTKCALNIKAVLEGGKPLYPVNEI